MHLFYLLSITASIPLKPSCCSLITGIPPPPAAITSVSFLISVLILSNSIIEMGCGEGTTRLYPLPASSTNINPFLFEFVQLLLCCKITIGFEGLLNAGSFSSTSTCVTSVTTCLSIPIECNSFCKLSCN